MVMRYYEITIRPTSGGWYQAQPRQGEGWEDAVPVGYIAIAEGRAQAQILEGQGEASKITQIGQAEAAVFAQKIAAYGDPRLFALRDVAERFANSRQPLVPERVFTTAGGTTGDSQGGLMQTLLALMISEKTETALDGKNSAPVAPKTNPAAPHSSPSDTPSA